MTLQEAVQQATVGLGYDLVEIERSAGGLLRVTIDHPWTSGLGQPITVDDCERVTRQLQYLLEVEEVEYRRLEVASPGIDRPLRADADFRRFAGEVVDVVLRLPIGADAAGHVSASRKKFRGILEAGEGGRWRVLWSDEPEPKPGQRVSRKRAAPVFQVLEFSLDELKEARLAPIVNFKGRAAPGESGE